MILRKLIKNIQESNLDIKNDVFMQFWHLRKMKMSKKKPNVKTD